MRSPTHHRSARPVGIKDIARALGVSIGTVDRALHARPEVSPVTCRRVLRTAEALGYQPNLAARYLKCPKKVRISVQMPRNIAPFWGAVRDGLREAATPFLPVLDIDFRTDCAAGECDIAVFKQALRTSADGLIISPTNPGMWKPHLKEAARRGIPVVCVVTDAPDSERLTSVSADPYSSGAIVAELLTRFLPGGGQVAFFTGSLTSSEHALKLRGFQEGLGSAGAAVTLASVVEAQDDEREANRQAVAVLRSNRDLKALYVSTANSLAVLRAAEQENRIGGLTIVTTDVFPELVPWIRAGKVAATVYQRPISQGRIALHALARFLLNDIRPGPRLRVAPHLVMRSNLDVLLEQLGVE